MYIPLGGMLTFLFFSFFAALPFSFHKRDPGPGGCRVVVVVISSFFFSILCVRLFHCLGPLCVVRAPGSHSFYHARLLCRRRPRLKINLGTLSPVVSRDRERAGGAPPPGEIQCFQETGALLETGILFGAVEMQGQPDQQGRRGTAARAS